MAISAIGIVYSITNIIIWKMDSDRNDANLDSINEKVTVKEKEDGNNTELITQEENIPKSNPYWDYIKMNMLDVDFKELKEINKDTVGWIKVNGTTINYPFVKTNNNKFYLKHSFDKSSNGAGWVFLDYRNNRTLLDKNNILYAHGRTNNRMFGSLKNILTSGWLKNKNNYVVKIATDNQTSLWQVFSVYHIPTTSDYIQVNFSDNNEFLLWVNTLLNRSAYNFNTKVNENDKILTLSTCYNNTDKVVLHAKLIKIEKK